MDDFEIESWVRSEDRVETVTLVIFDSETPKGYCWSMKCRQLFRSATADDMITALTAVWYLPCWNAETTRLGTQGKRNPMSHGRPRL